MSDTYLEINDRLWEQREHSEHPKDCKAPSNSHAGNNTGNSGNNSNNIIGLVDMQTLKQHAIEIMRPGITCHLDYFEINGKELKPGLYWHDTLNDNDIDIWIANPIIIDAVTSNIIGHEFGRLLQFLDTNGKWHTWPMPMRMLKSNGEDVLEVLLDQGFIYRKSKRTQLLDHLMMTKPTKNIISTSQIGWHGDTFILPNIVIGTTEIVFQSESPVNNDFQSKGTIEEWKNNIGVYCRDNKLLIASVATALAGTLFKQMNRNQGGGIHLVGDSSSGKSTSLEVAASVWGAPSFVRSWSATANGLEGIAATRNDTCLILDEVDEASPYDISKIIYILANGQGKQRANRNGVARSIQRWRTMALSSGERSLSNVLNEIHKEPNSGQLVRMINIDANFKYGVFENLHQFENGRDFSDHLKTARNKYYGTIGPKFVEHLSQDSQADILDTFDDIKEAFKPLAVKSLELRAASTLEIIALAGELGIKYGLLPWEPGSATLALIEVFHRWKNNGDGGSTEDEKIINQVIKFIDQYADSRFTVKDHLDIKTTGIRAGWYADTIDGRVYMMFGHALKEAGGNYSIVRIAKALKRYGAIVDHDTGGLTKNTRFGKDQKKLYYIRMPTEAN